MTNGRQKKLFQEFAGCLVNVTDEEGAPIAVGKLDENGVVRYEIDGKEYTQQLSHLVIGE